MKKTVHLLGFLLSIVMLIGISPMSAFAAGKVAINSTYFPDETFRERFVRTFDKDSNGYLSANEIAAVKKISCTRYSITSLKGVEYFTALTRLECYGNQLTSLDLSKNTALEYLDCNDNQLTSLDVSKNTALTKLSCGYNQLTSLDVSKNTALTYLYCYANQLTSLDLSKNTALTYLGAAGNGTNITVNTARTFDLTKLPGFDVTKASNWVGGTVKGNILTVNSGVTKVTYDYATGKDTVSFFLNVEVQSTPLATPVLSSVSNAATGVTVKWGAVSGAAKYRVFYKTGSGRWVKAGDTTGTAKTVKGLTSGTTYTFTVRCLDASGIYVSSYDTTGKSITYVAQPTISTLTNAATGVTVKWGAITGAAKYRVFYKTGSGRWVRAGDTTGTSKTVKGLTSGTTYTFTVRCLDASGNYISSYDTTGKSTTYVAQPTISTLTNTSTGVTVKWGAITGAAKYRVFYKTGSGSWVKAGDTTGTSKTVNGLTKGKTYTFTVRCLDASGNYISSYDTTGKSIVVK